MSTDLHKSMYPRFTEAGSGKLTAVGLDFGMSNTSIAVSNEARVEILCNDRQEAHTPSIVALDGDRFLIGEETTASTMKPENVIFGMKRFLDCTYEKLLTKNLYKPLVVENHDNKPMILVGDKRFHVEQIVAIFFTKLKNSIKRCNDKRLGGMVLTVPSSFDPAQRRALLDAAAMAEIPVLRLIEETTAAAITFACRKPDKKTRNVLIFQLGGGHIDVAVFCIVGHSIELLSSVASSDIGGDIFTQQILNIALKHPIFKEAKKSTRTLMQLRAACEKAKKDLSLSKEAMIKMDTGQLKYSRQSFETGNIHLKIIKWMIGFALNTACLSRDKIDHYFVIGRSAVLPSVKNMLNDYFGEDKRKDIINPGDGAVSGAAIMAEIVSGQLERPLCVFNNPNMGQIIISEEKVSTINEEIFRTSILQKQLDSLQKLVRSNHQLSFKFTVRAQVASGFSRDKFSQLANEVKTQAAADLNWIATDREKIKFSDDLHKIQDEIEELLQKKTNHDNKELLTKLNDRCQELDNWICDEEEIRASDFLERQNILQGISEILNSVMITDDKFNAPQGEITLKSEKEQDETEMDPSDKLLQETKCHQNKQLSKPGIVQNVQTSNKRIRNLEENPRKKQDENDERQQKIRRYVEASIEEQTCNNANEVKTQTAADINRLATDGEKIKFSEDLHKIQDEIEEHLTATADRNQKELLTDLNGKCQELDKWICDEKEILAADCHERRNTLQNIREIVNSVTSENEDKQYETQMGTFEELLHEAKSQQNKRASEPEKVQKPQMSNQRIRISENSRNEPNKNDGRQQKVQKNIEAPIEELRNNCKEASANDSPAQCVSLPLATSTKQQTFVEEPADTFVTKKLDDQTLVQEPAEFLTADESHKQTPFQEPADPWMTEESDTEEDVTRGTGRPDIPVQQGWFSWIFNQANDLLRPLFSRDEPKVAGTEAESRTNMTTSKNQRMNTFKVKERVVDKAKGDLKKTVVGIKHRSKHQEVIDKCDKTMQWLEQNRNVSLQSIQDKKKKIEMFDEEIRAAGPLQIFTKKN